MRVSGHSIYGFERKKSNMLRFKEDSSLKKITRVLWSVDEEF